MTRLIVQRLLTQLPIFGVVILLLFALSRETPVDPVIQSLSTQGIDFNEADADISSEIYSKEKKRLGLDLPLFYVSVKHNRENIFIPRFSINSKNQFQKWFSSLFDGGSLVSMIDGRPAWSKTWSALGITVRYVAPALLLAYLLSFFIGIWLANNQDGRVARILELELFVFAASPLFWLATLSVIYLTTSYYGSWLNWFPRVDVYPDGNIPGRVFILPTTLIIIHGLAYLVLQVKNIYLNISNAPFIEGLRAKGLSEKQVNRSHIVRHLMIPVSTLFTGAIATALSGSVVIEEIFNLPGMGRLLLDSIKLNDWNVVIPVLLIFSVVTMLSYLIGDILYTKLDPRIRL